MKKKMMVEVVTVWKGFQVILEAAGGGVGWRGKSAASELAWQREDVSE